MPMIFNDESRRKAKLKMYEIGFNFIKKQGLKRTLVEDITKKTGIAKGTFYKFFVSKESFVYEIIVHRRNNLKGRFNLLLQDNFISKENLKEFLKLMAFGEYDVYAYMSSEEIELLELKLTDYVTREYYYKNLTLMMLNSVENKSKDLNVDVAINYIRAFAIIIANKKQLKKSVLNETIELFIDNFVNYVFEK